MKILLLGKNGQLGQSLQHSLALLGDVVSPGRQDVDLREEERLISLLHAHKPDVIVNAAAYTDVDGAERDPETAAAVNAKAPGFLAREAAGIGALLVHYSTDYVFDGSGNAPWTEEDVPAPLGVYGRTKWEGDQAVQSSGCTYLILRSGWIYAAAAGRNFIRSILRAERQGGDLFVVGDQIGTPTDAKFLAQVTVRAIKEVRAVPEKAGLYHLCADGYVSRFDYAAYVLEAAGLSAARLQKVSYSEMPLIAPRPLNCRLSCRKFQDIFEIELPDWRAGVCATTQEILEGLS